MIHSLIWISIPSLQGMPGCKCLHREHTVLTLIFNFNLRTMKKIIEKTILCVLLLTTLGSCLKYDELRDNPNDPTSVPPSLLFTEVTPTPASSFSGLYRDAQFHNAIAADLG